jgi:hypothetical protein
VSRTTYEPRYGRVFELRGPDGQSSIAGFFLFPALQDGTLLELGDDLTRERFFRLSQGLMDGVVDHGTRVLCKGCPHSLLQHLMYSPDLFSDKPVKRPETPVGCLVPACPCVLWEPSDCRCYYGSGGNHAHPYRRWCGSCKARGARGGKYDDRAEATLPGLNMQPTPISGV